MKKKICDRCGKEIIPTLYSVPQQPGERTVDCIREVDPSIQFWIPGENCWPGLRHYDLCPDCRKKVAQFIEDGKSEDEFIDDFIKE